MDGNTGLPTVPGLRPIGLATGLALLVGACAAPAESMKLEREFALRSTIIELPENWRTLEPISFERLVDRLLPAGAEASFGAETGDMLAAALAGPVQDGVRAAVLLTRCGDERCAETLLSRLEQRVLGDERHSDAGDVVAAAGLAELEPERDSARRLADLASGSEPHPDLEVRVECARSALLLGRDSPIPFLLSVLRIGTREGRASGEFWPAPLRSAWARERAAQVLAWRGSTQNHYSADASIGDREREAARLEARLPTADR